MRILVVEDDPGVRHLIDRVLTRRGHHVIAAPSANEAWALLLDFPEPPHVALLDVILPDVFGPVLADRLRESFPQIRFIFMTGWLDPQHEEATQQRGALLRKPFTTPELVELVDR